MGLFSRIRGRKTALTNQADKLDELADRTVYLANNLNGLVEEVCNPTKTITTYGTGLDTSKGTREIVTLNGQVQALLDHLGLRIGIKDGELVVRKEKRPDWDTTKAGDKIFIDEYGLSQWNVADRKPTIEEII